MKSRNGLPMVCSEWQAKKNQNESSVLKKHPGGKLERLRQTNQIVDLQEMETHSKNEGLKNELMMANGCDFEVKMSELSGTRKKWDARELDDSTTKPPLTMFASAHSKSDLMTGLETDNHSASVGDEHLDDHQKQLDQIRQELQNAIDDRNMLEVRLGHLKDTVSHLEGELEQAGEQREQAINESSALPLLINTPSEKKPC